MPYLSAAKLEERVRDAGLQPLSDLLHQVVIGKELWAGPSTIEVKPEGREQIRNLIYGLLHHIGLKEFFQVTAPQPDVLVVDKKKCQKHTVTSITNTVVEPVEFGAVQEEDMADLFSESDPLLLSQNESAQSNEKGE
jgi:hypothetical protein